MSEPTSTTAPSRGESRVGTRRTPRRPSPRALRLVAVAVAALALAPLFVGPLAAPAEAATTGTAALPAAPSLRQSGCAAGTTLSVVAHQDDDLLFQSTALGADLRAGRCVTTVYVTAGDAGRASTYWRGREAGVRAAYAQTLGVADTWSSTTVSFGGRAVGLSRLGGSSKVQMVFLHLPDGGLDGKGFAATGRQSLPQLWAGTQSRLSTVDGLTSYSLGELRAQLVTIMKGVAPTNVDTLDHVGAIDDGDHPDHHVVAYLTDAARRQLTTAPGFAGWRGYGLSQVPVNLTDDQVRAKSLAFFRYAASDDGTCASWDACWGRPEYSWLSREQTVGTPTTTAPGGGPVTTTPVTTTPTTPAPTTPTPTDPATDVTAGAVATASSENGADGQTAAAAIDGVADGYPGVATAEWATVGGRAGSWLQLTWAAARSVDRLVLSDRPNVDDQVTGATLTFSDGSTVTVPALANGGGATTVSFPARSVSSVRVTVTAVSSTTRNVGLAEVRVQSTAAATTTPAPAPAPTRVDVTAGAVATAAWDDPSTGQTADKAIDGVADGYPTAPTAEWVAPWGRTGVTLTLTWPTAVTTDQVVLHDRPNGSDQVTAGTLTFSDGSTVDVPALADDGSATTVSFPSRSTTSVRFTVTGVSASTGNVGLAEIRVRGTR